MRKRIWATETENNRNNKKKIIVSAVSVFLIIIITVGLIIWVLFDRNGRDPVDHIIQDGSLNLSLKRENLNSNVLGNSGVLNNVTDDRTADFTNATDNNIFGLKGNTYIVPDCSFEAVMTVSNVGENAVPFAYWLSVETDGELNALASQLKATVTIGEEAVSFYLSEGLTFGTERAPADVVEAGETSSFSIKIEYDRLVATNESQGETVYFDLIVHAFQVV